MSPAGRIFDLQRFSLHDGPGIRTTVFLKGCPLRCRWCHNPESQAPGPELSYDAGRCADCSACSGACPQGCHSLADGRHQLVREACTACGTCAAACPNDALRLVGRAATAEEIVETALRDRPYHRRSGGGLTVSGGEPLLQAAFTHRICSLARAQGIHTAVETCGYAAPDAVDLLLPVVDLWLFDWKCSDPLLHQELTGVGNAPIRANLLRIAASGATIVLRCPLVPGLNDDDAHLDGIAGLAGSLPVRPRVELMAYHDLGAAKAVRIGRVADVEAPTADEGQMTTWIARLAQRGCPAQAG